MSRKVAEIIVDVLEQAGVKHCYGIVGDTLNLIAHHLDESDIEWVHVRHEEAGAFAAVGVLGIGTYSHLVLIANSDPLIVLLCLAAIDCHLSRRPRLAFAMLVLASLGRPEVWVFAGMYAVWYPVKVRSTVQPFLRWASRAARRVLCTEIMLHPDNTPLRLNGTGMVVLNAPWQLDQALSESMDVLARTLGGQSRVTWLAQDNDA